MDKFLFDWTTYHIWCFKMQWNCEHNIDSKNWLHRWQLQLIKACTCMHVQNCKIWQKDKNSKYYSEIKKTWLSPWLDSTHRLKFNVQGSLKKKTQWNLLLNQIFWILMITRVLLKLGVRCILWLMINLCTQSIMPCKQTVNSFFIHI